MKTTHEVTSPSAQFLEGLTKQKQGIDHMGVILINYRLQNFGLPRC